MHQGDRPRRAGSEKRAQGAPRGRGAGDGGRPQLVRELLDTYLERAGLRAGVAAAAVFSEWPELVGPGIADVTRVERVSDGVLVVAVRTSAWLMELNMMKRHLLARVNAGRGEGRFRQIVFVMDG